MYKAGGIHIFIDMWIKDIPESCEGLAYIKTASKNAGSNILGDILQEFDDNLYSYTGVLLLSESHASIHTWPEHNFLTIDFFFCGNSKYNKAIEYVMQHFKYDKIKIEKYQRGE